MNARPDADVCPARVPSPGPPSSRTDSLPAARVSIICSNCLLYYPKNERSTKKTCFPGLFVKDQNEEGTADRLISWSTAGANEPSPVLSPMDPVLFPRSPSHGEREIGFTDRPLFYSLNYVYELFMSGEVVCREQILFFLVCRLFERRVFFCLSNLLPDNSLCPAVVPACSSL